MNTFESVRIMLDSMDVKYNYTHVGTMFVFYAYYNGVEHVIKAI